MKNQNVTYWISAGLFFLACMLLIATLFFSLWQLLVILSLLFFSLYKVCIIYSGIKPSPMQDLFIFLFVPSNEGWDDISKLKKKDGSFIQYIRRDRAHRRDKM